MSGKIFVSGPKIDESRSKIIWLFLILILSSLPFLTFSFPPSTDLPQHVSQIRLFLEAIKNMDGPYAIQWVAPNNLIYAFLGMAWALFRPEIVGRIVLWFITLAWIVSIYCLAARRERSREAGVLACLLLFNHAFYWGFLNFLIGWPIFVLWFLLTIKNKQNSLRLGSFLFSLMIAFLLYESHALWFAVGFIWLVIISLIERISLRIFIFRFASLLPIVLISAIWYPSLSTFRETAGFDVAPHWYTSPFARLNPSWLLNSALGGIQGLAETVIFCFLIGWILLGVWENRKQLKGVIDWKMLTVAGLFLAIAFLAPDKYMNTICFSSRWFPCGVIFLILALPAPLTKTSLRRFVSLALFAGFIVTTFLAWNNFEKIELSGLKDALDKIPNSSHVIGLDFVKQSEFIKGRPFLQIYSYSQVLKGGELNFSFAEHSSGIVTYKSPRQIQWTRGLAWFAEHIKKSDLRYFDYALINGKEEVHKTFSSFKELSQINPTGRWRLYRIRKE